MAFALISSVIAGSVGGTGFTSGSIDTSGASILIATATDYPAVTEGAITDSKGNTWTQAVSVSNGSSSRDRILYSTNPTVGSGHTFSFSAPAGSTYGTIIVMAFSGAALASPFDQSNSNTGGNSTTIQPGSVTPTEDNELVITVCGLYPNEAPTLSIDGGFTIAQQNTYDDGDHYGAGAAYLIQTTAAAANPTWTATSNQLLVSAIATFKAESVSTFIPKIMWFQ